jgi:hypothetical protein
MAGTELVPVDIFEVHTMRSARHWEMVATTWAWSVVDWAFSYPEYARNYPELHRNAIRTPFRQMQACRHWAALDRRAVKRMGERG